MAHSSVRLTLEDLASLAAEAAIDTVYCITPDWHGQPYGKRLHVRHFLDKCRSGQGVGFPMCVFAVDIGQDLPPALAPFGGAETGYTNGVLIPDLTTLQTVAWLPRTAIVFCDPHETGSDRPLAIAPRAILRAAVDRLGRHGLTMKCASELEFFAYEQSITEAAAAGYANLSATSRLNNPYIALQYAEDEEYLSSLSQALEASGIPVESFSSEVGLGQKEINVRPDGPIQMADKHVLFKWAIKTLSNRMGRSVTFMARPDAQQPGNSFHLHLSLWANGAGLRMDGPSQLQPGLLEQCLGGLVATGPGLTLLYAPTLNSYRRFQDHSFAPTSFSCGWDNRTCAFRLLHADGVTRVENRVPGADASPYLVIAATIGGLLHGLENRLSLPPLVTGDAYGAPSASPVPTSLGQAINASGQSQIARSVLGPVAFEYLLAVARAEESALLAGQVTDYELRRYFERV